MYGGMVAEIILVNPATKNRAWLAICGTETAQCERNVNAKTNLCRRTKPGLQDATWQLHFSYSAAIEILGDTTIYMAIHHGLPDTVNNSLAGLPMQSLLGNYIRSCHAAWNLLPPSGRQRLSLAVHVYLRPVLEQHGAYHEPTF